MKKIIKILIAAIAVVIAVSIIYNEKKYVIADINSAESSVIGAASSTFYYQGSYYRVKSTYINQLINALDTQYDLTSSQASACVSYIYNNVAAGISSGYLYKVDVKEETGEYEDAPNVDTSYEEGAPEIPEDEIPEDADYITADNDKENIVNLDEMNIPQKSKEELIDETTNLAADMGVNISYDSGKNGITITDKSGNVLVSMNNAVKNTGFRLNSLIVFPVCLFAAVLLILILSWRLGLFSREQADE